ncbi:MAG: protein kinase [Polyangiales bacterium]
MPQAPPDLPRPFGPYELVRLLAAGNVVDIFLAQARAASGFQKAVAIKMIRPAHLDDDPEFVRQLVEEANIASRLQHKNVVQVVDLGEIDRQHYIAMEYVDGIDLATLLNRLGRRRAVPPRVAAFIVREVCEGLDHAHRKADAEGKPLRIVHRAVSPSNILLSNAGDVKLNDFGLAKASLRAASTQAGQIKGKYAYMAPEQARGHAVDPRADVFAAGLVLYELVTGRSAYPDAPLPLLLERLTRGVIEPAEKVAPDLHPVLANIIRRATAADLAQRHPSARALADDLDVFLRMLGGSPEAELAQLLERVSDTARSQLAPLVDDMSHEVTSLEAEVKYGKTTATPAAAARKVPAGIGSNHPTVDAAAAPANVARVRHAPLRPDPLPAPGAAARVSTPPPVPAVAKAATPRPMPAAGRPGPSAPPPGEKAPSVPPPADPVMSSSVLRAPSLPGPKRPPVPAADDHPTEVMDSEGPDAALLATAAAIAPFVQRAPSPPPPAAPPTDRPPPEKPAARAAEVPAPKPAEKPAEAPAAPVAEEPRVVVAPAPSPDVTSPHRAQPSRPPPRARQRPILVAVGVGVVVGVAGALALAIALAR